MYAQIFLVIFPYLLIVDAQLELPGVSAQGGRPHVNVHLDKISTLYVPSRYNSYDYPEFKLGKHAAEQLAYDPAQKILYVTGEERLNVIDLSNPKDPIILYRKQFDKMDPTDVEYCGNHVFVTVNNDAKPEDGKVLVFRKYNRRHNTMPIVLDVVVGPSPNMLLPTTNCQKVLVSLEGEPFVREGSLVDPEGAIGLLKFPSSFISDTTYSYKIINFRAFNNKVPMLERSGVRFVYRDNGNSFAQDLEPEHITLSADEKKAYISLQENNAIAEVDMVTEAVTDIRGLGFKDWRRYKIDPSDGDRGIHVLPFPVYGMYQPDAIRTITIGGREYIVTADEGESKDYSGMKLTTPGFDETKRAKDITISENSEILQWARERGIPNIQVEAFLGKLYITTQNGRQRDGKFDQLYSFGGRGFSILRSDTMERIYDSGSIVEETHARQFPELFNSYVKSSSNITDTFDSRSDSRGPECESLAVAYDGTRVIIFLGCERPGTISIYSFDRNMTGGTLESMYTGAKTIVGTWGDAFSNGLLTDMDIDDIKYLPPFQSPTGQPLLLVTGSDTGTISLFHVRGIDNPLPNPRVNSRVPVKPLQSSALKESVNTRGATHPTGSRQPKATGRGRQTRKTSQRNNIRSNKPSPGQKNRRSNKQKAARKTGRKAGRKTSVSRKTKGRSKAKKPVKTTKNQRSNKRTKPKKSKSKSKRI